MLFNLHRKLVHSGERFQTLGVCALPLFFSSNATRPHWRRRFSCLHQVPIHALKEKAKLYVDQGLIRQDLAERVIRVIESGRGDSFYVNDVPADAQDAAAGGGDSLSTRLSPEQMRALLERRVEMMKQGHVGNGAAVTDQYRVYSEIVARLQQGRPAQPECDSSPLLHTHSSTSTHTREEYMRTEPTGTLSPSSRRYLHRSQILRDPMG